MNYEKGSEWRRWELHIHTPGTQKNDNFAGVSCDDKWNKYYEDIHAYIGNGEDPLKNNRLSVHRQLQKSSSR